MNSANELGKQLLEIILKHPIFNIKPKAVILILIDDEGSQWVSNFKTRDSVLLVLSRLLEGKPMPNTMIKKENVH